MSKFDVILADCPWPYDDKRTQVSSGMVLSQYKTMTIQDIRDLPVQQLASPDCALFLWSTCPKLDEALPVMKAWGFRYITVAFVWVKLNPSGKGIRSGMGHWTNANAEFVLMGKVGYPRRISTTEKQIIMAPVGKHSVKPPDVHRRIEYLLGNQVRRLEMFARAQVPNWTCVGDGITGNDIRVDLENLIGLP